MLDARFTSDAWSRLGFVIVLGLLVVWNLQAPLGAGITVVVVAGAAGNLIRTELSKGPVRDFLRDCMSS